MAGHPIDSLFVEIGLDASKFDKQQQEALGRFKRTQDLALKGARDVEDSGRSVVDTLDGIKTQALEMFAVVSGGKSLVAFSTNLTHADAAVGRLSRSTGASVETISKWQAAARIFGGSAEGMANTFATISDTVAGFKVGAVSPLLEQFRLLSAAGGTFVDVSKSTEEVLLAISDNMEKISKKDPALAGFMGRSMGFDPASIDMLIKGPSSLQKVLDYVNGIGVAAKEDADAFGEMEKRMSQMGLKAESMGRKILGGEGGGAEAIIGLADWLHESPGGAWNDFKKMYADQIERSGGVGGFLRDLITFNWNAHAAAPKKAERLFPQEDGGAFKSNADRVAFIRAEATRQGQNPDVWEKLYAGEGKAGYAGDYDATGKPTSFGAFQLHYPGVGRNTADGLGTLFTKETGLDARDPNTEHEQIAWSMRFARKNGLSPWHGWHGDQWANLTAGAGAQTTHDDHSIHVDKIEINASAGADGAKIARDFRSELLRRQSEAFLANGGQQ